MGASFKEQIAADISSVFLNDLEFADEHEFNGKTLKVVVDDNELIERDKAQLMSTSIDGIHKTRRLIYVSESDFGKRPAPGMILTLDGKPFRAKSCTSEAGILGIEIEAIKS